MRPRHLLATIICVMFFAVILVPFITDSIPSSAITQNDPTYDGRDKLAATVEIQVDPGEPISSPTEPITTLAAPEPDGPSLLARYCARCHIAQQLEQIQKTRGEWEKTLGQMENMGVTLSNSERVILLNYLAAADEP